MKSIFFSFIIFVLLVSPYFVFAQVSTQPVSSTDLQSQIQSLFKQIQVLQQQVLALQQELGKPPESSTSAKTETPPASTVSSEPEATPPELTRSLSRGSSGEDVRKLQEFLAKDKEIYPEGLLTGFFGPLTEIAVKKWQEKYGVEAIGIIGPKSIAKLKDLGRGRIQQLIEQGAGASGVIPPGLLIAPGIQKKIETIVLTPTATTTPAVATTTTPSGVVPAVPATPAIPSPGSGIVAVPATPAVTTATTATSTATTTTAVAPPVFTITSPNGGEQWTSGNTYTITWTSAGTNVSTVNLDLYKSGSYSTSIAYDVSNSGSISWTVPSTIVAGSDYKIRVYSNAYYNNFDESNNYFSIIVPIVAPSTPPIGYWKFDGSGNNEITGSPGAVTVGNATFKASGGKFGGYLYMPASSDYAKIPYNSMFDLPGSFTVEFWFRQRSNQSFNQNLVYKGTPTNNYNFNIFRNLWNQYNFGPVIAGSTAAGTGYWHQVSNPNEPPHNTWHHVVYTKTTEGGAYYIDGVLIHSRSYGPTGIGSEYYGPVKTPTVDIVIGNPAPDTDIDNLRIYNYSLSRGEVLYNWENVPGVVVAFDTAPPSTPTNFTASTTSSSQINLSWSASTDNIGVTGYRIYRGGAQIATVATSTFYSDTGLVAATAYSYTVSAYDAAGNVSAPSNQASAITLSAGPPAPTNIQAVTTASSQNQPPQMWYYLVFNYTLQSTTQSFNIYRKRPADSSFVKYTYSAQMSVNPSILPLPGSGESSLYRRDPNQWSWYTTLPAPAPANAAGEYQFYVTAIDTGGVESSPSATKSLKIYAAPTINSPADGSTVFSPFTITVTGDPNAPSYASYGMALYKKTTGDTAWSAWPAPSTNFTYTGSALSPSDNPHRLVVWLSADGSSFHGTSIFNISTATTSSLDSRAKNLAAISQTLETIKEKLLEFLQGL